MDDKSMSVTLSAVANSDRPILPSGGRKKKDEFNRDQVVNAFARAFEILGGIPRLALWGNENYGDFAKLYAKLLPATSVQLGDIGQLNIIHSLPPTALDQHPGYPVHDIVIVETREDLNGDR